MTLRNIVLFVSDIQKSNSFYRTILDQEIEYDFGANIGYKSGLAIWRITANHEIAISEDTETRSVRTELYFELEDLETIKNKVVQNKVTLLHDIKTESWGQKTIRFFDPDHHLIEVGEPLEVFVGRIYKETGSLDETSEQTGVNRKMVKEILKI